MEVRGLFIYIKYQKIYTISISLALNMYASHSLFCDSGMGLQLRLIITIMNFIVVGSPDNGEIMVENVESAETHGIQNR